MTFADVRAVLVADISPGRFSPSAASVFLAALILRFLANRATSTSPARR